MNDLHEWYWFMKEKKLSNVLACFELHCYTLTWKNHENIACTDFVNVNIALNLYFYEEN